MKNFLQINNDLAHNIGGEVDDRGEIGVFRFIYVVEE